ncbi:flagellar hook-length control protein FliK [Kordiimonas aquimaris]|uniref:flagellar hook-length control protein FliK n=1 Tax=Kordiimonas aquimaris TaxID=707591 RepID=UPI0021D0D43A|nr:flagellar hook-length control protein FliK [Kordiimonas aquimaris]
MNAVENVTTNLLPLLGNTPTDLAGLTGEVSATDIQEALNGFPEHIAQLTSVLPETRGTEQTAAYAELQQTANAGLAATPTDENLLIDPTVTDGNPIIVQSLRGAGVFFPSFDEEDPTATPLIGIIGLEDGLSVGFTATTQELGSISQTAPLVASSPQEAATDTVSAKFSPLPTVTELANANSLTQIRGAGHVLPVAELNSVHTTVQSSVNTAAGSAPITEISPANNTNTPQVSPTSASTGTPVNATLIQTPSASDELNSFANNAFKQVETQQLGRQAAIQASSDGAATRGNAENIIDENIDADGQVLNVLQKSRENGFLANQRIQNQTSTNSPTSTQTASLTAASAAPQSFESATARSTPITEKRETLNISTPSDAAISTRTNIDQVAPVQRTSVDWSSPWSGTWTPERAAGLTDGLGTDTIASGLTGLRGDGTGLLGMGLMGGKPNPTMGGHIAKQLNVNVTRAVKAGENEFAMRMDPPELGKVTVKLKFGADGMVRANVFVERPETLELLQREARGLERAIEAGGSKTEDDGITFSLDSGGEESAGKAFAEAMQEDRLKDALKENSSTDSTIDDRNPEDLTETVDLEEILAHVTPETGLDVRV